LASRDGYLGGIDIRYAEKTDDCIRLTVADEWLITEKDDNKHSWFCIYSPELTNAIERAAPLE